MNPRDLTPPTVSDSLHVADSFVNHHSKYSAPSKPPLTSGAGEPLFEKRAAVILYSYYPADPRPRRAAEAMIHAGMTVDLLCLRESDRKPATEIVNGVNVLRLPVRKSRESKFAYVSQYLQFLVACSAVLAYRTARKRYDVVHAHNMPDFLVFSGLLPKLFGSKIMLDLHDPMPELVRGIYDLSPSHWLVRILTRFERWSIAFADLVLTPNKAFRDVFISRGCPPEKLHIIMNSPEPEIFDPDHEAGDANAAPSNDEFRIMHHGLIAKRHGIDLLVEAVAYLRPRIARLRLDIYGSYTPFLDSVLTLAQDLGAADIVHYHGPKSQIEIAAAIRKCHLGVVPNRRLAFTEINFPTRLFEYLSMHRPVLAPATKGIQDYFNPDQLLMFEPNDVNDLASKILWVKANPQAVQKLVERGLHVYRKNAWVRQKTCFLEVVKSLIRR